MILHALPAVLAMMPPPNGQQPTAPWWTNVVPFVLIILVFYFALIRPQQKKARAHEELIKGVRPKDKIVTTSGIIGSVVAVGEKSISIRSGDTKLDILKSAVAEVTERAAAEPAESKS